MSNFLAAAASSSAAAISQSSSSDEEEVSDVIVAHSGDEDKKSMTNDQAANDNDDFDLESIFCRDARDIQKRTSRAVGTAAMEDRRFCELFGASVGILLHVWTAMEEGSLLPKKSRPKHLLWMIYFFKVYPREAAGCSAVGGGGGAIDPKTLRK